jgi:hypothetical protein
MMTQGVYFEVVVKNTSTLFLSLHNVPGQIHRPSKLLSTSAADSSHRLNVVHVPFRPVSLREEPSPPISLLARVDQEEYILLPNASALVTVCNHDLSKSDEHRIRIIAPMIDNNGTGIVELEGIWLSKGGRLLRTEGTSFDDEYEDEDAFSTEIGRVGRIGLGELSENDVCSKSEKENVGCERQDGPLNVETRKKMLEVITDNPGSFTGNRRSGRTGGADGLLAGVMGWEYLLGEIFGADHVGIGVDGMCLTQSCIGGVGQPSGIGDVFFRRSVIRVTYFWTITGERTLRADSGPFGSEYFEHPWMFDAYVPDVIVSREFDLFMKLI